MPTPRLIVGASYYSTTRHRTAIITAIGPSWAGYIVVSFDLYEQNSPTPYRTNAKLTPEDFASIYNRSVALAE